MFFLLGGLWILTIGTAISCCFEGLDFFQSLFGETYSLDKITACNSPQLIATEAEKQPDRIFFDVA